MKNFRWLGMSLTLLAMSSIAQANSICGKALNDAYNSTANETCMNFTIHNSAGKLSAICETDGVDSQTKYSIISCQDIVTDGGYLSNCIGTLTASATCPA